MGDGQVDEQRRIAALLLDVIGEEGFALAGSGAIREHGITDRPTQDIDLFATSATDPKQFAKALERAEEALTANGFRVARVRSAPLFARLLIGPQGEGPEIVEVDLAVDWRQEPPVRLSVGPVLALPDAVGNKVATVYSRGEVRDFLDLDAIRRSNRYSDDDLLRLAQSYDGSFDPIMFARQLTSIDRLSAERTAAYGVDAEALELLKQSLMAWAEHILNRKPDKATDS